MQRAYVGLGSNLANPPVQIESGLRAIAALPRSRLSARSRLYRSAPWGRRDQPEFVNAVASLDTALGPRELLDALLAIERSAGRERGAGRWGPRTLDLDILAYADVQCDEPGLHLPHPHAHERAFVLLPLAEIAPDLLIPGHGTVVDLASRLDSGDCRPLEPQPAATE